MHYPFFPLLFPCSPFYLLVSPSTEFPRNPLPLCFQRLSVLQCTGSLHLNIRTNLALKLENRVRIEDSCCQVGVVSPLQTALLGHQGQRAAVVQQQQHNRPLLPPPPPLMDQQARSQYHLMEVTTGAMVAGSDHQHHLHQLTAQQQQQHSVALYTSSTATQQQTLGAAATTLPCRPFPALNLRYRRIRPQRLLRPSVAPSSCLKRRPRRSSTFLSCTASWAKTTTPK